MTLQKHSRWLSRSRDGVNRCLVSKYDTGFRNPAKQLIGDGREGLSLLIFLMTGEQIARYPLQVHEQVPGFFGLATE